MAENGIPLSWQVALPDLNNVFNNLLGGAGSAISSVTNNGLNRLEGLQTSFNNSQSTGTTTVTIPPQGTDTFSRIGDGFSNIGYGFQGLRETAGELIDNAKTTIGNFIADSKFAETMKGITGAGGTCYNAVWRGLLENGKNPDSKWAKLIPDLDSATSGLHKHAYQFAEAMDTKLVPEGKVKNIKDSVKKPEDVPVGAICVVDQKYFPSGQAAISGDINVALGNGNFRNYGDMTSLMSDPAVWNGHILGVYVPV
jgi:hypothetical protein